MRFVVTVSCLLISVAVATAATPNSHPARPPIQVLDEMIVHLRAVQSAMQKEAKTPTDHWQEDLGKLTEPLVASVNELSRMGAHTSSPSSAYGLRVLYNSLRSSRDPRQALQTSEQLVQTVSFLRSEHQLAAQKQLSSPRIDREKARDVMAEVLKRSEFHQATKPHFFDFYLNRLIVKVIAWFHGLFDSAAMRQAGQFAYLFLWLVYLVVGFLVIWLVYRAWAPRRKIADDPTRDTSAGIQLLTPESHLAAAEAMCKEGNHAGAVREYFLMMLATLEQRNFVARNRSWTNWEYLGAFGKRVREEAARSQMSQLNSVYDQVSYGGAGCDAQRFTTFRKSVDDFLSALPTSQPS
ncbi:MAG: DUF4129 domain-containing protein [Verrucomicrobiae bacterium]|nr:DUF4129 domain-containing protein [Verrucomicrobiae bacterium]